jgi:hypothetical protein
LIKEKYLVLYEEEEEEEEDLSGCLLVICSHFDNGGRERERESGWRSI